VALEVAKANMSPRFGRAILTQSLSRQRERGITVVATRIKQRSLSDHRVNEEVAGAIAQLRKHI